MMMTYVLLLALAVSEFTTNRLPEMPKETTVVQAVNQNFIPVDGSSLKSKIDSAVRLGRANGRNGRFYVAYGFNVKPGVTLGGNYYGTNDSRKEGKGKTYREK